VFTLGIPGEGNALRATTAAAAARAFYQSRGFQSVRELTEFGLTWTYFQEDRSANEVWPVNYLRLREKLAGCESMPTGPMIVRHLNIREEDSPVTNPRILSNALSAAGMSREDYDHAVSALTVARREAGDPGALNTLESMLPQMSGDEKARYRAAIDISKANRAVFLAHAAVLEPLLATHNELMGAP
jgi:hypothetical protein